jgi:hypothetical protein
MVSVYYIRYDIRSDVGYDILTVNGSNWNPFLEKCSVNVEHNRHWNFATNFELPVLVLVKRKVLMPCQAHICHKFAQDSFHQALARLQYLITITLNGYVNNLNVAAVDGGLQLLRDVSINFICIERWIFHTSLIRTLIALELSKCFKKMP